MREVAPRLAIVHYTCSGALCLVVPAPPISFQTGPVERPADTAVAAAGAGVR